MKHIFIHIFFTLLLLIAFLVDLTDLFSTFIWEFKLIKNKFTHTKEILKIIDKYL